MSTCYRCRGRYKSGNRNDELKHTIRTIILAAACLEAFINQEGIKILDREFYWYDKGQIDVCGRDLSNSGRRGYPNLEDKWCEVTERIGGRQFDKGKTTFQDFSKLVDLRNEILHYKAISAPPVPSPPWGNVTPERARFNALAARDAVKVMKEMLQEFHALTSQNPPAWIT